MGRVVANKTDRGRKISLLTHKWIKYKGHGSCVRYMERQQELQVNTTKIAKMKKKNGSQRSDGECETQAWGEKQLQSRDVFVK